MLYFNRGVEMRNLEEIKTDLKEMQGNFNPKKQTYKIIDEIFRT